MAKDYGPNVTGFLDPDLRAYETTVYQQSKPVLDKELNLVQDLAQFKSRQVRTGVPSGWLSAGVLDSSATEDLFTASAVANELEFPALSALVNDWQIPVQHTNETTSSNKIDLGAGPAGVGAKRTDLVILEVWRRLISASPDTDGKSPAGRIWRNGNVKIDSADDLALNPADEILDGAVAAETTKRVQIQYRVRVFQGVDLDNFPQGLDDPTVFAHTVPPAAVTPDGVATAYNFTNQSANGDGGLWRAGDGNPANGIGTVDGYMYAIPLCAVFRRNTNAFDQDSNMNGGVATPGPSDRPDGLFHDVIAARDVLDLRFHISRTGWDLQELLSKNVNYLFDNVNQTEQETTPQAGGQVGHTNLWADEIGPTDNPGPTLIRNFDSVSRRFSDRSILESVWVRYTPSDQNGGGPNWTSGDFITIDPTALPIYPYASLNLSSVAPSLISIVDIPAAVYVWDGSLTTLGTVVHGYVDDTQGATGVFFTETQQARSITGLGGAPQGSITFTLGSSAPGVAQYDLYIQLIISYPSGADATGGGLTRTPTADFGTASFVNETPANLPAGSPYLFQAMETQAYDAPHREVELTYRTLDHTFTQGYRVISFASQKGLPSDNHSVLFCPDRIGTVNSITNVDTGETYTGSINLTDDGYFIIVENVGGNWSGATPASEGDEIELNFEAIRPVPSNDVQFTLWYEARAPQTIRSDLLGTTITVIPRYTCPHLYTLATGSGAQGTAYPFPQQYVQSPGVYPTSGGSFGGDHELDGSGTLTTASFSTDTGFVQFPTLVPMVPEPQSLVFNRLGGDIDAEGRSFFKEVPAGYTPTAFAEPLTDAKTHKNIIPMICELASDGPIGPKGTLLLVMVSRWSSDSENKVGFDSNLANNRTSASIYRLKGNPLSNRRV